jgi:hypothetical protein
MFVAIAICVLAAVAFLVAKVGGGGKRRPVSPLAKFALFLIIAGMVLGESRLVGYVLIGSGVVLALIDMKRGWRK